ncbi:MAG: hypothetical protein A2W03_03905 [Candidatus Aminicenantes bacterium RBG_16_63_16]|nr:MAG: hypothetical protein A2W03_03905 [Candidatus Aminicenantes bacterium RBG_16_63_16]
MIRKAQGLPAIILLFLVISVHLLWAAQPEPISPEEARSWMRHLLPLPHEIAIKGKFALPPAELSIRLRENATEIEKQAAEQVRGLFKEKAGIAPEGKSFEIRLGVMEAGEGPDGGSNPRIRRLKTLPNNEQAYVIFPDGDNRLVLGGLNGRGVFYAAATLCQLLKPYLTPRRAVIPLAEVVDWPDLEERGLWNFPDPPSWIPWLAGMKLNYGKMADTRIQPVKRGEPNRAAINRDLMMKARLMGFNYLPYIIHYNFLKDSGLYSAYPEIAGAGDRALAGRYFAHKIGDEHRVPNASHPLFAKILAEWMMDIASQGAGEVSCWLSERPAESEDRETGTAGQFVWEARATVTAWKEVLKTHPDFKIRLFLSTTTSERYFRVLAETPPEVKIERACASWIERVPRAPRDLYVNALLDSYAAEGRWLATYDVPLGAYGRVDTPEYKVPCSSAHRIKDYLSQLYKRKWRGAYGMIAWDDRLRPGVIAKETYEFNIAALAEWTWNIGGRSEKEFAAAWATREGYENPEAVGEWGELMGPVEFDVYDSEYPVLYSWGRAVNLIEERKRPVLSEGLFRYYEDRDAFDRKMSVCDKACAIAVEFKDPYLANETRVVRSYIGLAKHIFEIAEQVATEALSSLESQARLKENLKKLEDAGKENTSALRRWRSALGPEPWHDRFHDAVRGTETTVGEIRQIISGKYLYD